MICADVRDQFSLHMVQILSRALTALDVIEPVSRGVDGVVSGYSVREGPVSEIGTNRIVFCSGIAI